MGYYFEVCLLGMLTGSVHASGVYFSPPQSDNTEAVSIHEKAVKSEGHRNFTQEDLNRIANSIEQSEENQSDPVQALVRAHPEIVLRATQLNNTRLLALLSKCNVSARTIPEINTATDNQGNGPLHIAVRQGNLEALVLLFVGLGLDPTLRNNRGFDVFGEAALRQDNFGKLTFNILGSHDLKKDKSPNSRKCRVSGASLDKSL
ncbi:MAG: hypothetical protein LW808_001110 [Verrucomicrobiota bacterium]|nr:MAG: hypothetical protein LW808_001110 [Verrucomicrobiota bacterium]